MLKQMVALRDLEPLLTDFKIVKRKEGFVVRVMAAVGGSVVILGVATGIAALAG